MASGGLPVVDVTATKPLLGTPVSEAVAAGGVKYGVAVTKVTANGMAVTFVVPPP
ncbi:MAG TPA: hypothetical protein VE200_04810 [Xanthobacteraceae bacterium]|nr:hypothetical protein [Xanthobacteraceae bacterium]